VAIKKKSLVAQSRIAWTLKDICTNPRNTNPNLGIAASVAHVFANTGPHAMGALDTIARNRLEIAQALVESPVPEFSPYYVELDTLAKTAEIEEQIVHLLSSGYQRFVFRGADRRMLIDQVFPLCRLSQSLQIPCQINISIGVGGCADAQDAQDLFERMMENQNIRNNDIGIAISLNDELMQMKSGPVCWEINFFSNEDLLKNSLEGSTRIHANDRIGTAQTLTIVTNGKLVQLTPKQFHFSDYTALGFCQERYVPGFTVWSADLDEMSHAFGNNRQSLVFGNYNLKFNSAKIDRYFDGRRAMVPNHSRMVIVARGLDPEQEIETTTHEIAHDLWFGGGISVQERENLRRSILVWVLRALGEDLLGDLAKTAAKEDMILLINKEIERARAGGDEKRARAIEFFAGIDLSYYNHAVLKDLPNILGKMFSSGSLGRIREVELFCTECFAYAVASMLSSDREKVGRVPEELVRGLNYMTPSLFAKPALPKVNKL
jgi:hypothetical protein